MKKIFVMIPLVLLLSAWIDPFKDEVEKGNKSYADNDFIKALEHYKDAEKFIPNDKKKNMLDFNKGDAHYKLEDYDKALDRFGDSISSGDADVQKKALFNMGNVYVKQKKYKEAVDCFIKALEIDPNYEKAKKNLEYLLKKQDNKDNQDNQDNKDQNRDKNNSSNQGNDKDKNQDRSKKNLNDDQVKNLLESMKNKPVRQQKDKGNGKRHLDKYW
ncbi:MAG: tetratricopeptide repeat protein [Leptospirales bacterium]|nr:tetratricopeptide repeat protein [Leptospirales bacterium]